MTTRSVPIGQLQTVINTAVTGDVLLLAAGVHKSTTPITVNKKLTIDGQNAATIDAPTNTILVRAADITFKNVTVTGATGRDNALFNQTVPGLVLDNVKLIGVGQPSDPDTARTVFGIRNYQTGSVKVIGGEWTKLAIGIQFERGGQGSDIDGVWMHDMDRMRVNDTTAGTDTGGNALAFFNAIGPIRVGNCKIERTRAQSFDYGADGSAFEFYGSGTGGVVIEDNEVIDCLLVCETGKSAGDADYDNVTFRRNIFRSTNPAQVSDSKLASNGFYMRSAKNWIIEDNEFRDLDWWIFAFDYSSTQYTGAVSNIIARRNTVYLKPGVNRWLSFGANVPLTVFSSADNKVYQPAVAGSVIGERPGLKTNVLATWRNGAAGHETGASYWGTAPVTPPTTDPNLAKISQLEAQVASLTTSLAQANTALASANAATNAAQTQATTYLNKLNALRASVTSNVADLNAANTAAQP